MKITINDPMAHPGTTTCVTCGGGLVLGTCPACAQQQVLQQQYQNLQQQYKNQLLLHRPKHVYSCGACGYRMAIAAGITIPANCPVCGDLAASVGLRPKRRRRIMVPCFLEVNEADHEFMVRARVVAHMHPRWLKHILSLASVRLSDPEGNAACGVSALEFKEDASVELDGLLIGEMEPEDVAKAMPEKVVP